jgi:hypothetical protein
MFYPGVIDGRLNSGEKDGVMPLPPNYTAFVR